MMELTIDDIAVINNVIRKLNATKPYGIYQAIKEDGPISFYLPSLFPETTIREGMSPDVVELRVSQVYLDEKGKIKIGLNK